MNEKYTPGLRLFLLTLIRIITAEKLETCEYVEKSIKRGVASDLYEKYKDFFVDKGFQSDALKNIDEYYRKWYGCADGNEMRKYGCSEENGLFLLIALALNEIY